MPISSSGFGAFGEALMVLVAIVVPAALVAAVAYWVIRLAVRDGVLDARRRCGEVVPEVDPDLVSVSSRGRKALYLVGAVLLVLGIVAMAVNVTTGPVLALIGLRSLLLTPRYSQSTLSRSLKAKVVG